MSIAAIQRRRLFEEVTRVFYATGEKPRLADMLSEVSRYFAKYPAGAPLTATNGFATDGMRSDVNLVNQAFLGMQHNLSVAYEASLEQIRDIMMITSVLQADIERLRGRRNAIMSKIDDYLFTLFNADGYYMSLSDTFNDLDHTDLNLTTAFVDTTMGKVSLPTNAALTMPLSSANINESPAIMVLVDGKISSYRPMSPFASGIDGLDNTIWAIEVETSSPTSEVMVGVSIAVGAPGGSAWISKIEFDPWGIQPVQVMFRTIENSVPTVQTGSMTLDGSVDLTSTADLAIRKINIPSEINDTQTFEQLGFIGADFDNRIVTTADKLILNDSVRPVTKVNMFMRKTTADYTTRTSGGTTVSRYIFGAKDIVFTRQVFDREATFVSSPLSIPAEMSSDHVIDAVAIVSQASVPTSTQLDYWVAANVEGATEIGDFEWKKISPLEKTNRTPDTIVKFNGAINNIYNINAHPAGGELQLVPENTAPGTAAADINPSSTIIPGVDVWRLAQFDDEILPTSTLLEEGVNTARIMHVPTPANTDNDLTFWAPYVSGAQTATEIYTRIDTGMGFFDGGVIGEGDQYVYVETYVETDSASELFIRNLRKLDANSRNWDVTAFLNGREVGSLPINTDFLAIPWKLVEGLNHVVLLISIPAANSDAPQVYDGKIALMEDSNLYDFGTVKLATWNYTDFFHMQYNEVGSPFTFTIRDTADNKKEIISRRKPTDNFRFKFAKGTGNGPAAVRLRADLKRADENSSVSPSLDLYRMRFLYA